MWGPCAFRAVKLCQSATITGLSTVLPGIVRKNMLMRVPTTGLPKASQACQADLLAWPSGRDTPFVRHGNQITRLLYN